MTAPRDLSGELHESVRRACAEGESIAIAGTGSKAFLTEIDGQRQAGRLLSVTEHTGVIEYRPEELVITARAGTPLKELEQLLAREHQLLPFDPPRFRGLGTLGGAVACGLAGPARPWRGSVRDAVLGVTLVNGLGQRLALGGRVVKNVAGFDLSRLQVGAFGTLGLLLDVSVRVIPAPAVELTCALEVTAQDAQMLVRGWARRPLPVSATAHVDGRLHVRLSGAESAVLSARREIGGEASTDLRFWAHLRDHELPFFRSCAPLSVRTPAPAATIDPAEGLLEWGGARRWAHAQSRGGAAAAVAFGAGYARYRCVHATDGSAIDYRARIRRAFDPEGLFNPELGGADVAS